MLIAAGGRDIPVTLPGIGFPGAAYDGPVLLRRVGPLQHACSTKELVIDWMQQLLVLWDLLRSWKQLEAVIAKALPVAPLNCQLTAAASLALPLAKATCLGAGAGASAS